MAKIGALHLRLTALRKATDPLVTLRSTILFDPIWYRESNLDLRGTSIDAEKHYLNYGAQEGRNPHPLFDTKYYLSHTPDAAASDINPLVHYLRRKSFANAHPHPLFDVELYIATVDDFASSGLDPLTHYLTIGWKQGSRPNKFFDPVKYLEQHPDARATGFEPFSHFLQHGSYQATNEHTFIDSNLGLKPNSDVGSSIIGSVADDVERKSLFFQNAHHAEEIDILLCLPRNQLTILHGSDDLAWRPGRESEWMTIAKHIDVIIEDDGEPPKIKNEHYPNLTFHVTSQSARFLSIAANRAMTTPRDLLIIFAPIALSMEAIRHLQQAIRADPMTGFAIPRTASKDGMNINVIPPTQFKERRRFPRHFLQSMEATCIVPEAPSPVTLVRSDILAAIPVPLHDSRLAPSLKSFISDARRCGFLTLVDNRCVLLDMNDGPLGGGISTLSSQFGSSAAIQERLLKHDGLRWERLCAGLVALPPRSGPSILLDARELRPWHNGTGTNICGILRGLDAADDTTNVYVLVNFDAEKFHGLRQRYAKVRLLNNVGGARFDVVLRLSQCWTLEQWRELHTWGRTIAAEILDSIAVDTVYLSKESNFNAYQFGAERADGLTFISHHTKNLFEARFRPSAEVKLCVNHLSFDLSEYQVSRCYTEKMPKDRSSILVVGNTYRHKDVEQTVHIIANAFPSQIVRSVGPELKLANHNVESYVSGRVDEPTMARLYSQAKVVVFPSFYEGFGLPVLEGLANGAIVICRAGPLLQEIADRLKPGQNLFSFSNTIELTDKLSHLIQGEPLTPLPLGAALLADSFPDGWAVVAQRLLRFASEIAASADPARWRARDRLLRQVLELRDTKNADDEF